MRAKWEMIRLVYSRKAVMESFLRRVGVRKAGLPYFGWPRLIRAVTGVCQS